MGAVSHVRPAPAISTLAAARVGSRLRVTTIDAAHAVELSREGLRPGTVVEITSRTPLGGPVIVTLGRVRLALAAGVAAAVVGEPVP
jgi:Fe2+ transport system protein FeoA